jgi:hypothetical protein
MGLGRAWHLATALVVTFAVVVHLVLVWQGNAVLDEVDPPALGERLVRFVGYFTVLSNILVAVAGVAWEVDQKTSWTPEGR